MTYRAFYVYLLLLYGDIPFNIDTHALTVSDQNFDSFVIGKRGQSISNSKCTIKDCLHPHSMFLLGDGDGDGRGHLPPLKMFCPPSKFQSPKMFMKNEGHIETIIIYNTTSVHINHKYI